MRRRDLLTQLAELITDVAAALGPADGFAQLSALCRSARLAFDAAAVSVAELDGDVLRYRAADGAGASVIVGTELPVSRGLAGYVAVTGQALAVDRPADDPRFARDIAERTGYVPSSLLVVPIDGRRGVAGVLSVLDRSIGSADALELAASFAAQAAMILPAASDTNRATRVLVEAIVAAAAAGDATIAPALRRALSRGSADAELAEIAATLNDLRSLDPDMRSKVLTLIADVVQLAAPRRRR